MKKLLTLSFLILIKLLTVNGQNITVKFTHDPIRACSDNIVTVDVIFAAATPTYGANLFVAIDLGAHLPTNVTDLSNYQIIYNDANPLNTVENVPGPRYVFIDLGSNQFPAGTVTKHFTLRLNCKSITGSNNIITNEDDVFLTVGQFLTPQTNGTGPLPLVDWTIAVVANPAPPLNTINSTAYSRIFPYYLNYVFINNGNSFNLGVNYIDWHNGTATRELTYQVAATQPALSSGYDLQLSFIETFECNKANIAAIEISILRTGSPILLVYSASGNTSNIIQISNQTVTLMDGDVIKIHETFEYPDYLNNCVVQDCSALQQSTILNSTLNWGCEEMDFNHTVITSQLCNPININNRVVQGPKEENVSISRTTPLPSGGSISSYWTFSDGPVTTWEYVIENLDNGLTDAAKNLIVSITEDPNQSSFYFLSPIDIEVISTDGTALLSSSLVNYPTPLPNPLPSCRSAFPNAIIGAYYNAGVLLPGQTITVRINLHYCCPSADIGGTGVYSIFDVDKYLNTWRVAATFLDECNNYSNNTDPGPITVDHFGTEGTDHISRNGAGSKLYLKQNFTPPSLDIDVTDTVTNCSTWPLNLNIQNFKFNLNYYNSYDQNAANVFSSLVDFFSTSNVMTGKLVFKFELKAGLELMTGASDYSLIYLNNNSPWPVNVPPAIGTQCSENIYTIEYDFSACPGGATPSNIYAFLNNSSFSFSIMGCCCPNTTDKNPGFKIQTYLKGNDQTCEIPMCEKAGNLSIHCPGCNMPGGIVQASTKSLSRSTLGFEDDLNDGLADNITPMGSSYIQTHNVALNHSMVGDELLTDIIANIDNSSLPINMSYLNSNGIFLSHLYIEQKIENSNSDRFDVNITDVEVTINSTNNAYDSHFTLNKADALFSSLIHDDRNGPNFNDIIFYDLSESVIQDITGHAFEIVGNEQIRIQSRLNVCKNYTPNGNSMLPSDNEFASRVLINMYLTEEDLVSQNIFDAFTHGLRDIAQDVGTTTYGNLYFCEGRNNNHYFYSVRPVITAYIDDIYNETGSNCTKLLIVDNNTLIGGEILNVFPYEFRAVPHISGINVHLPGPISGYNFLASLPGNLNVSSSTIRTYNDLNCGAANYHYALFNQNIPFSTFLNIPSSPATQVLSSQIPLTPCNVDLPPQNNIYSSDEYLLEHFVFPFTWNDCNSEEVFSSIYQSSPPIAPYIETTYDLGTAPANTTCQSTMVIQTNFLNIGVSVSSPSSELAPPTTTLTNITVNAPQTCFDFKLENLDQNLVILNPFIYIPLPATAFYSDVTINGVNATILNTNTGQIAFFDFQSDPFSPHETKTYTICFQTANCNNTQPNIPIFYGWNCDGPPTLLDINNNDICFVEHQDQPVDFAPMQVDPSLSLVGSTNLDLDYLLCNSYTVEATLFVFNGYVDNLTFDIVKYDPTIQINSVTFSYKHSNSAAVPFLNSIPTTQNNLTTTYYMQDQATQFYYPGYLSSSDKIIMTVVFTPTQPWTGTPATSPFGFDYHYTTYCGDGGGALQRLELTKYTFLPGGCNLLNVQSPNLLTCALSNTQLSTIVSNGIPGYTYLWTMNPAGTNPTGANPIVNPNVTTDYTVQVTDAYGTTGSTTIHVEVLPELNCCVPTFNVAQDLNYSGIKVTDLPYRSIHTTNNIVLINGEFRVDDDFKFNSCQDIVLGPGASITVDPGITLEIFDSHIYSCDQMSSGIFAGANSRINFLGSKIEDAHRGISLSDGCSLTSKNSWFWNNYIGINITPPLGYMGAPYHVNVLVSGTDFESTRFLRPKYTGQPELPLKYGFAGIYAQNVSFLDIGAGVTSRNYFKKLNEGIFVIKTALNVENCRFMEIQNYDTYPQAGWLNGTAIRGNSKWGANYQLTVRGADDDLKPDFIDCHNAIVSSAYSQTIINNVMSNCDLGIESRLTSKAFIEISNNRIECNSVGISLLSNDDPNSLDVTNNHIYAGRNATRLDGTGAFAKGIDIQNNAVSHNFGFNGRISDNYIQLYPYGDKGIHMNSVVLYDVTRNYIVLDNMNNTTLTGILIENSTLNSISCNGILGNRLDQSYYYDLEAAMRISTSRNNSINQNGMSYTSNGLVLHGNCSDFNTGLSTSIQKNSFGSHYYGLHYTTTAIMNPQDHSGNIWLVPGTIIGKNAIEENTPRIQLDKYFVSGIGNSLPNPYTPGWFTADFQADLIIDASDCGSLPTPFVDGGVNRLLEVALDSLQSIDNQKELLWQAKVALYEYLLKHPEELTSSADLEDFYIANAATAIHYIASLNLERNEIFNNQASVLEDIKNRSFEIYQKSMLLRKCDSILVLENLSERETDSINQLSTQLMYALDYLIQTNEQAMTALKISVMAKVDLLSQQNDSIGGFEIYERNESQVNAVYFSTVAIGEPDSLINFATILGSISYQCPIEGGPAVFRARALYKLIYPNFSVDDISTCLQSGYTYRSTNHLQGSSRFYPNPTTGEFNLVYTIQNDSKLQILDCLGRICKEYNLPSQATNFKGTLESLENGLYYYRMLDSKDELLTTGKVILNK